MFTWTDTYTTIVAAFLGGSFAAVLFEPIVNKIRLLRTYRGWQAVFLSNNQVYFGKIKTITKDDITLTNIYYLQTKDRKQHKKYHGGELPTDTSIVKLGEELHAPEDTMIVGRSHILFSENLKDSAEVVQAIKEFESKASSWRSAYNF